MKRLREEGYQVYDFRTHPHGGSGFNWTDVDENAQNWTFEEYAGVWVIILVIVYIPEIVKPELMYKTFDEIVGSLDDLSKSLSL